MSKLGLIALAASAATFSTAAAAEPPKAGHSWQERAAGAAMPAAAREVRREVMRRGGHGDRRFVHIPRIGRGGMIPHAWFGPQFVVRNWHMHGFPQPFAGGRWIRYYDDALLVDRYGRVHDGRYGWDWDRHGDRWGHDRDGVPIYVGDGDFEPEEFDYEWAERHERRGDRDVRVRRHGPGRDDCGNPCTRTYHVPPPPHGGHGPAYGYGYGCGCGPVVVTETITTTAPVVEQVTYYEYETEYVRERAAPKKRKVVRRLAPAPKPRPKPGERG